MLGRAAMLESLGESRAVTHKLGWELLLKSSAFFNCSTPCLKGKESACTLCWHHPHRKLLDCASTERCKVCKDCPYSWGCNATQDAARSKHSGLSPCSTQKVFCVTREPHPLAGISQIFQVCSPIACLNFLMRSLWWNETIVPWGIWIS